MTPSSPLAVPEALVLRRGGTPAPAAAPSRAARGEGAPVASRSTAPAETGRRYGLRGRHIREHRLVRVGLALAAADIADADDLLVLQVLRRRPLGTLDAAQVAAEAALTPSAVASCLDRLVRSGLARDLLVDGRIRFGLP